MEERECRVCGKKFMAKYENHILCSDECRKAYKRHYQRKYYRWTKAEMETPPCGSLPTGDEPPRKEDTEAETRRFIYAPPDALAIIVPFMQEMQRTHEGYP